MIFNAVTETSLLSKSALKSKYFVFQITFGIHNEFARK